MDPSLSERLQSGLGDAFTIERELSRGALATVLVAFDQRNRRRVAIKVMHPGLDVGVPGARFRREMEIAASLSHPHIVPLLDSGTADGLQYYIMPYIEGHSLRTRLEDQGQLDIDEALRLAHQVALALQYAHDRDLVHRDIKPENILLAGGEAVVTDFGIARTGRQTAVQSLTTSGIVVGTPAYMSPEQGSGGAIDARSDVYSLGCVLYEMIVGHAPFLGLTVQELLARHALDPVPPARTSRPTVSEALEAALRRALAKNPADRYGSAAEFAAVIEQLRTTTGGGGTTREIRRWPGTRASRRWWAGLAGAGVIAAIVIAVAIGRRGEGAPAEAAGPVRLAVLPMRSLGLQDEDHFTEGLTDEITFRLARLASLAVVARNSALNYPRDGRSAGEIGRELGVDFLLEGTVRLDTAGGRRVVRITPSLVRVRDGVQTWNAAIDGVVADVFSLQSAVAQQVAEALQLNLDAPERRGLETPSAANVEAYREYVLGRFYWKRRTPDDLVRAVEHFEAAVAADPVFSRAYSGLADCYVLFGQFGVTAFSRDAAWARAREAAQRAITLDATLAEAHASLGEVLFYSDWNWGEAERHFRAAIAQDRHYATAHQWYAELLAITGRFDEAVLEGQLAVQLEPVSAVANHALAMALVGARRYEEAATQYRRVLEVTPQAPTGAAPDLAAQPGNLLRVYSHLGLSWIHIARGEYDSAVAARARVGLPGDTTATVRLWIRAAIDSSYRRGAAQALAAAAPLTSQWPDELLAQTYAAIGDADRTIELLDRLVRERRGNTPPGVRFVPLYDPVRHDRRFEALLQQLGLAAAR